MARVPATVAGGRSASIDNGAMGARRQTSVPTGPIVALMLSWAALAGCSTRAVYQAVQGWQQQGCRKIADAAERQRCLSSTAGSYDDYRRAREAAPGRKSPP